MTIQPDNQKRSLEQQVALGILTLTPLINVRTRHQEREDGFEVWEHQNVTIR